MVRTLVCSLALCLWVAVMPSLFEPSLFGQDPNFVLKSESASGFVGENIPSRVFLDNAEGVAGASWGRCHDAAIVDIECTVGSDCIDNGIITQGVDLQATNNGQGAQFFAPAVTASPSTGYTVGVVVNLLGLDSLAPSTDADLLCVLYRGVAEGTSPVDFCETGSPLVLISMGIAGGGDVVPTVENGIIEVTLFVAQSFIRGDCNDDGRTNVADGVWILNELFHSGPSTLCRDACDTNQDGMFDSTDAIFVFSYRFLDGPAPGAPFPDCGNLDNQDCELTENEACN